MPLFMVLDGRLCSSSEFARHSFQEFQVRDWTFGALTHASPDLCGLDVLLIDMTSLTSTGRFAAFWLSVCAEAVCQ